jgi:hypothetical protein
VPPAGNGVPTASAGACASGSASRSGKTAERDNANLYLLHNAAVNQIERYLV